MGLKVKVYTSGFRIQASGFGASGFRVYFSVFRILGFRVQPY